ncbi:hypothetical protein [Streptomyces sp. NPDC006274]|uniref:hypothetical protein n=1 Tax=unclassified Streptomyces TaxID=2593676 RepID=UPI0033AA288C
MLIRFRVPLLAAVTAALLPLTGCSAEGPHPVFTEPLAARPEAAVRVTRDEGSASFTQTVTYGTERGDAVQTTTGRLDFTDSRGAANRSWRRPKKLPAATRGTLLGPPPMHGPVETEAAITVDKRFVHYRPGPARYWLRYGADPGSPLDGSDEIRSLRGRAAAVGGTLLEIAGGARATAETTTLDGGRSYRAQFPLSDAWFLFPERVRAGMTQAWPAGAGASPVRMTLTVDAAGRITEAEADVSALADRENRALSGVTGVRIRLALSGYGSSEPEMPGPSDTVLDPAETVVAMHYGGAEPGDCLDFGTGVGFDGIAVRVDCGQPHAARVYAREPIGNLAYAPAAESDDMASDRCDRAYLRAPDRWTEEAVDDAFWFVYTGEEDWGEPEAALTCYVLSR